MEYQIYTDGGCSGNKRDSNCPGGYAYVILDPAESVLESGSGRVENTTNNRMEMLAVIEGLHALRKMLGRDAKLHSCVVVTDSKYVCENYVDYLPGWRRNGWKKANGKGVLNVDMWKRIDEVTPEFKSFRFKWVKGHASNRFNEMVDGMAQGQIRDGG